MYEKMSKAELLEQVQLLEKKQALLQEELKQTEHIRKLWHQSVNELQKTKAQLAQSEHELLNAILPQHEPTHAQSALGCLKKLKCGLDIIYADLTE